MRHVSVKCVTLQVVGLMLIWSLQTVLSLGADSALALGSSAFQNGGTIPERYTCSGSNRSPALEWTGVPGSSRSLTLILDDPDAPIGTFVHWVMYNIPPTTKGLPDGVPASATFGHSEQGVNGRGDIGYAGPCPPPGKPHHYHFHLDALDQTLDLKPGATRQQVDAAMKGHVVGSTELIGIFER
jgi:Raf kinase inhibitor-like YbhB/YbcL family protein